VGAHLTPVEDEGAGERMVGHRFVHHFCKDRNSRNLEFVKPAR
jgi:hypothetical protein